MGDKVSVLKRAVPKETLGRFLTQNHENVSNKSSKFTQIVVLLPLKAIISGDFEKPPAKFIFQFKWKHIMLLNNPNITTIALSIRCARMYKKKFMMEIFRKNILFFVWCVCKLNTLIDYEIIFYRIYLHHSLLYYKQIGTVEWTIFFLSDLTFFIKRVQVPVWNEHW